MSHEGTERYGHWFSRGDVIRVALPIALLAMIFLPLIRGTAHAVVGDVRLCSAKASGGEGNGDCFYPAITPDGRYVAFHSDATNLGPATSGFLQVFRKDMQTGEVRLVSSDASGNEANSLSKRPSVSADGRYVAFQSNATNLGPAVTAWQNIFVKDLDTGEVLLVSANASGTPQNGRGGRPAMTPDGRYVVFNSYATNLGPATSGDSQVFRKDMQTGEVKLASSDASGNEANDWNQRSSISADGRYVTFHSYATNLGPATSGVFLQVFRKDLETGEVRLVSSDTSGNEANSDTYAPSISADGRYVAFDSDATNLGPATSGAFLQVFRKDLETGEVRLVSSDASGNKGDGDNWRPSISGNGRYVSFPSEATCLVSPATSGDSQVFRKDLKTGEVRVVSSDATGNEGNDGSGAGAVTPDGRYTAFQSYATNLDAAATGTNIQILRKELPSPRIEYVIKRVRFLGDSPGPALTYTIAIENTGEVDVQGLYLNDAIPAGTSVVADSVTCSDAGATLVSEDPVAITGITVVAGESVTISFQVTLNEGMNAGPRIENQAFLGYMGMKMPSSDPSDPGGEKPTVFYPGGMLGSGGGCFLSTVH